MKRRKAKARLSAGFELERLGLWALRYPRMALLLIALVTPPLIWASSQLGFSSDIREIFRSGSADFSRLEEVAAQYPGTGRDILLVIEDENLFTVETLDRLRELHLALPLIDGVKYVHSMFSARSPPDAAGKTTQLFPFEMSQIKDLEALQEAVRAHPLIGDKLLSRDGSLCLFVVALKEENREVEELRALVSEIRTLADEELDTARTDLAFTGLAVMRIEIIGALKRDQRLFGLVGMSIGVLLCWIYFRSLAYVVIAMAPAGLAIMWLRGSMHLAGQEMNVLTNVVPVIVMVIVLANALHLLFGIRRGLQQGAKIEAAIEDAVRTIGPATVLTSATTTLALLSLMLVQHAFITRFGLTAAVGTAIAYIATMSAVPPLALFMLGHSARAKESIQRSEPLMRGIARFSAAVARFARTQPTAITLVGVALAGICALLFAANETRYRYLDNLPTANPAYQAIAHIDQKLAGPNLLQLLVQWRDGARFDNGETLLVVAKAHGVLTSEPAIKAITSLTSVATWFAADGRDSKDLFAFLEEVRSPTASRVYSADKRSALLSANFPDLDAAELLPILDRIEEKLDGLRQRFQGHRLRADRDRASFSARQHGDDRAAQSLLADCDCSDHRADRSGLPFVDRGARIDPAQHPADRHCRCGAVSVRHGFAVHHRRRLHHRFRHRRRQHDPRTQPLPPGARSRPGARRRHRRERHGDRPGADRQHQRVDLRHRRHRFERAADGAALRPGLDYGAGERLDRRHGIPAGNSAYRRGFALQTRRQDLVNAS